VGGPGLLAEQPRRAPPIVAADDRPEVLVSKNTSGVAQQPGDDAEDRPADAAERRAQLDLLREENRRLRAERRRLLQTRYRHTALGLAVLGTIALAGAVLFPPARDVLLALAGVGLFGGVLVYYLTPERFIAATVGEATYDALARTGERLVGDLGLTDHRVYVPKGGETRLFVPQHEAYDVPDADDLDGIVVTDDEKRRGLAVHPTGGGLYREFERTVTGEPAEEPPLLAEQLADAVVEGFELADSATGDGEAGRLTVAVTDPVYGDVDGFDHPVASLVGVAVAATTDVPVEVDVASSDDDRVDAVVTASWESRPNGD
jgi:hypothetical protein